jgi:hypothetical protein
MHGDCEMIPCVFYCVSVEGGMDIAKFHKRKIFFNPSRNKYKLINHLSSAKRFKLASIKCRYPEKSQ